MPLIKKIYSLAAGSAVVCSAGAVVSFLSSNNTAISAPVAETIKEVKEKKWPEFKATENKGVGTDSEYLLPHKDWFI